MYAVTRKLKSRSGISLSIALVFFLLCTMVGMVVLSYASTSAGNTAWERQLYRETLALTSAADLLSQDIQTMTYTGSYTRTETVTTIVTGGPDEEPSTRVETSEENKLNAPTLTSQLFEVIPGTDSDQLNLTARYIMKQSALENANYMVEPPPQTIKFAAVPEQHIPEVNGTLTVGEDYTLTVKLHCGEKNGLTMSFPPHVVSRTKIDGPETEKSSDSVTQRITKTTYVTTLTWGQPLMKEGGAGNA